MVLQSVFVVQKSWSTVHPLWPASRSARSIARQGSLAGQVSGPLSGPTRQHHAGMICTGETYKNVVKMTFRPSPKAPWLEDPSGLFNSSLDGNTRRATDIHEDDNINEKALKALIRAAVALNRKTVASAQDFANTIPDVVSPPIPASSRSLRYAPAPWPSARAMPQAVPDPAASSQPSTTPAPMRRIAFSRVRLPAASHRR